VLRQAGKSQFFKGHMTDHTERKVDPDKSRTFVISLIITAVLLGLLPAVARFLEDGTQADGLLLIFLGLFLAVVFFSFCLIAAATYAYQKQFLWFLFYLLMPFVTVSVAYLGFKYQLPSEEYSLRFRLFLEQKWVDELSADARARYDAKESTPTFLLWKTRGLAVSAGTETYLIHVLDDKSEASILRGEPIKGIKINKLHGPQRTFEASKILKLYKDCVSRTWKMHSGYFVRKHYCPH
jgi:hypothetical protein